MLLRVAPRELRIVNLAEGGLRAIVRNFAKIDKVDYYHSKLVMTNLAKESDQVVLSHEEIIEMYLAIIKSAADQALERKRQTILLNVSPDVLKQLMDSQIKTKKCECCEYCRRSPVPLLASSGYSNRLCPSNQQI